MMANFEYFAPNQIEEALTLLSDYRDQSKIIAGGQSLLILMRQGLIAPKYLIDIKGISCLDYIHFDAKEGLRIGALASHRDIEKSKLIRNGFGVIAEMEQRLASVQTRNWGTIGGNLCHGDPTGDPAPVLIALKAKVKLQNLNGERTLLLEEFFKDYFETALQNDELFIEISVPKPPPHTGTAFTKFSLIAGDYAIASAAVSITLDKNLGECSDARIALGSAASVPIRARQAENLLLGKQITERTLEEAARSASDGARPVTDAQFSEGYRRELLRVLVRRVGSDAFKRASSR
jgi:carbon-monoxide dehydrogenase medium subunit